MGTVAEEAAARSFFVEGRVPEQREQGENGLLFPQVLKPGAASSADVNSLVAAIKKDKDWLEQQLALYGALLLRDFGVHTAEDFNAVVEAFDYPELPYIGGAAPRFKVVGRVYTTNESPPDQLVPFHHEMAQVLLLLLLLLLPISQIMFSLDPLTIYMHVLPSNQEILIAHTCRFICVPSSSSWIHENLVDHLTCSQKIQTTNPLWKNSQTQCSWKPL
jgi:hypothetical protein